MDDFFTASSFLTLGGCVAAVTLVVNAIQHVFRWGPRWFGLLCSILVSMFGLAVARAGSDATFATNGTTLEGILPWVFAFLNGFLIYTSAFGVQNTILAKPSVSSEQDTGQAEGPPAAPPPDFFSPW